MSTSRQAGIHRATRLLQSSTIAEITSPLGRGGSCLAHGRPASAHRRQQHELAVRGTRTVRCARRPAKKFSSTRMFRCGRRESARAGAPGTIQRRDLQRAAALAPGSSADIAAVPLTKTRRRPSRRPTCPPPRATSSRASVPIEIVPAKRWCSPAGAVGMAGISLTSSEHGRSSACSLAVTVGPARDRVSVIQRQVGTVLLTGGPQAGSLSTATMLGSWLDVRPIRLPALADGRTKIHLAVHQLLLLPKFFSS